MHLSFVLSECFTTHPSLKCEPPIPKSSSHSDLWLRNPIPCDFSWKTFWWLILSTVAIFSLQLTFRHLYHWNFWTIVQKIPMSKYLSIPGFLHPPVSTSRRRSMFNTGRKTLGVVDLDSIRHLITPFSLDLTVTFYFGVLIRCPRILSSHFVFCSFC